MVNLSKIDKIIFNVLENSDIFCLVCTSQGKVIYANTGALKIMDYAYRELIGKSIFSLFFNFSEVESFLNTGKVFKGFIQGRQKLGKSFYIYSEIYPIIENGKIFGFVFLGEKTFERETKKSSL